MSHAHSASDMDMLECIAKMQCGDLSVIDVVKAKLQQLDAWNPKLNAVISRQDEPALVRARELEQVPLNQRKEMPFFGVPVTIKDNICTKDLPTTCGSKILKNFYSNYDASSVRRLRESGAIIIGKTNCDEFAMGSSTENSCYGPTRNPWKLDCVSGGTSGGSAAAVAAGMGFVSLGSDTGGSVRQPAGFCGVVGLKPTYGRVSRFGLIAHGSSLDQIGILGRRVRDCARTLEVIGGKDSFDMTTKDFNNGGLSTSVGELRIAALDPTKIKCQSEVSETFVSATDFFKSSSSSFEHINFDFLEIAVPLYYVISTAEAASNLSRYDGIRYGDISQSISNQDLVSAARTENFGLETKRRILLGTFVLSEGYFDQYYARAKQIRAWLVEKFIKIFQNHDLIMLPTSPTTAFEIGSKIDDPIQMYLSDIFTTIANLIGVPAVSVPAGFDKNGLPIGLQLMGSWGEENRLLAAAEAFERQNPIYERSQPKLH